MPFKSDAQRKYLNMLANEGKFPKAKINEFNQASKGLKLPEHVKKYNGGIINTMKNFKMFPPAGVKFAEGGVVEEDNAGLSDKFAGAEEFDEAGEESCECPACGHKYAHGGQVTPFGGDESPEEEMMEHEMPAPISNVSQKPMHQNPDHESMQRRARFAKGIMRHNKS